MKAKFEDIERELWLRMREANQIIWSTKEGDQIPINQMSLSHLVNTYNMILRQREIIRREEALREELSFITSEDIQL